MAPAGTDIASLGAAALVAGVLIAIAGAVLVVVGGVTEGEGDGAGASAGGVVFLGPIPVVVGTDRGAIWLSLAIAVAMILFYALVLR